MADPHDRGDDPLSHNLAQITSLLFPYFIKYGENNGGTDWN
jgi:hypothetical protein